MLHRNAHSSWLEGRNPAFLEEEIKKASWARSRKLKQWHHSLERQGQVEEDQASIELSARDAAALMLGTIISLAILGEMNMFLNHSKPSIFIPLLGIVGPLLRPRLGPQASGLTNLDIITQFKRVCISLRKEDGSR